MTFCLYLSLAFGAQRLQAAEDHYGQVTVGGVAVPGATVTASQGDKKVVTSTDAQGVYKLADLADGAWMIQVEMLGFSTLSRAITVAAEQAPATWELTLMPFAEIARVQQNLVVENPVKAPPAAATAASAAKGGPSKPAAPGQAAAAGAQGFRRTGVAASAPAGSAPAAPFEPPDDGMGAADGLLINGSVNNGAASPFAQLRAFGNNRPGQRSLYNGGIGLLSGNSAWDARPFSFSGQQTPKPSYNDVHVLGTFGGPLRIPGVARNLATMFVGYQHTSDHNARTQSALLPTLLEREGDFSRTVDAAGRPVPIVDPSTGRPFTGSLIPPDRISPQAAALLGYYPRPNLDGGGRFNFQSPVLNVTRQDSVQTRLTRPVNMRNQLFGTFAYQRTSTDTTDLFGFEDATEVSGVDAAANWSYRVSQFLSLRLRYQFTRLTNSTTPFFSNRTNVSGEAGILGNNQEPENWGPPSLVFANGTESLSDGVTSFTRSRTNAWSTEDFWFRGRHTVTFGGSVRQHQIDIRSQQDPRGMFSFTGYASGSDFADFLLGLPRASAIAFGNADKDLRGFSYDGFVSDDWRVSPSLTVNAGIRWEYESPITERLGRLVNLDIAPGFAAVSPVLATSPLGALTGERYPESLVKPDRRGFQPRIGVAWRPLPGSSLVIRGGYGIYRNTSVYQSIATALAQQPPLSKTVSVQTSPENPLTLANGFVAAPGAASSTFAIDPDFRVGYAHNWQVSMQRDLPASLNVMVTYLGTSGRQLVQQFLPNTFPAGTAGSCAACPAGFVYLASNGSSSRHAGQFQLRRRLRGGLTASATYTLAEALDDAPAFSHANVNSAFVAQDWLDLAAEYGRSNFDQRHLLAAQFEYTTGVGVGGGALLSGLKGSLIKGWTMTSQLNMGSGLPFTPVYLVPVPRTGVTGSVRATLTGAPTDAPDGFYLNPAAYGPPAAGQWGNAGRNSATGPAQFSLNSGVSRTFPWKQRLYLDWRIEATNVLNRVTYANVNAIAGSPQFGLPTRANSMRKLQSSLRLRF